MGCPGRFEKHPMPPDNCPGCGECEYCPCGQRLYCKDVDANGRLA